MESESVFLFRKCERAADCFSILTSMKENDELCDVTIYVGSRSFQAHRVILAAGIPYFRAMFNSNMVECTKKEITLEDVDPVALENLINFVYTHELKFTLKNVVPILKASMYLQLDLVVDACFEFLYKRISFSTVLEIRSCAVLANKVDMVENAERYIRENFEDFSLSSEFADLSFTMLKGIICRDDLFVMKEETVFEAVMRWVKASEIDRCTLLPELLPHIRMPLITKEYLNTHVCGEKLIQASPSCNVMIHEAKIYHTSPKEKITSFSFATRERFCKEKNHLKCAKLWDCGLYVICKGSSSVFVSYHDPVSTKLVSLGDPLDIDSMYIKYVACTEDNIYFLYDKCIQALNLKTLQLTLLKHNHKFPGDSGVVIHQHKIYFFGGFGAGVSDNVYSFDLQNSSYVKKGKMLNKRFCPSAASMEEFIYVTGGYYGIAGLRSAERYNSVTGQTSGIAKMLNKRFGHGCAALNGKIYVCGGNCNSVTISGEIYDPLSNHWNSISRMTTIAGSLCLLSYASELSIIDNRVWSESGLLVKTYNPSKDKWQFGIPCSFPSERCEFLSAVITNSASPVLSKLGISWTDIYMEDSLTLDTSSDSDDSFDF